MRLRKLPYFSLIIIGFVLSFSTNGFAHEIRPAYLEITELESSNSESKEYHLLWKVPITQGRYININPILDNVIDEQETSSIDNGEALIREFKIVTSQSIKGSFLRIENIEKTLIDVLVEMHFEDETYYTALLQPSSPKYFIPIEFSFLEVIKTYFKLGVEHILIGYDHLLFVLGLFLLIPGFYTLIKTITSFTIAHSITLILASLNLISVPSSPVEAVIAISIVLLAWEVKNQWEN